MTRRLGAIVVGMVATTSSAASAVSQVPVTAFVDVSVVPMDREQVLSGQTVLVQGDRIIALGPAREVAVPAGARRVDGRGKFLLPGFADMHVHLGDTVPTIGEASLLLFIANGVTTVRNMHGGGRGQEALLDLKRRVAGGELLGPRIYTAGEPNWRSSAAAARSVAEIKANGHDFVAIGDEDDQTGLGYDTVLVIARQARLRIAGHVPSRRGIVGVLRERWASVEHLTGYFNYLLDGYDPDGLLSQADMAGSLVDTADWLRPEYRVDAKRVGTLATATQRAGVWNCPTLRRWHYFDFSAPAVSAVVSPADADMTTDRPKPPKQRKPPKSPKPPKPLPYDAALANSLGPLLRVARRLGEVADGITKALQEAGAGLLLGTDTGNDDFPDAPPGFSVATEMKLAVKAGLTPYQALAMGTRNVAAFMGTSDSVGTVALGKRADLVLLDGNPLQDIGRVAGPAGVMVGGRWFARADLETRLDRLGTWKEFDLAAVRRTMWPTAEPPR